MTDHLKLYLYKGGEPVQVMRLGDSHRYLTESLTPYTRLPGGHPEGFHEALANLHKTIQLQIRKNNGEDVPAAFPHPDVVDGVAGMAFIEAAVKSSADNGAWTDVTKA
jgi:hypothetical protein